MEVTNMSKLSRWLTEEQLYVKPRTRCKGCNETVAQIFKRYGENAISEGRWLDIGDDYQTAIDESKAGWYCYPCLEYDESEPKAIITLHDDGMAYKFHIGGFGIYETGD